MKQRYTKLKSVALAALTTMGLTLGALSETVENVKYIDGKGVERTCPVATVVEESDERVTWSAGWYVVNSDVTLSKGADCSGAVNLILADGAKLTIEEVDSGNAGIGVLGDNNSLTIYGQSAGTGALTVMGGGSDYDLAGAGIGGGANGNGSYITINGGTVTATGGGGDNAPAGAGIGGGANGSGSYITIIGVAGLALRRKLA